MKILILQLSKLDSCIRTLDVVDGLRLSYAESSISLALCREEAKELAELPHGADHVIDFDKKSLLDPVIKNRDARDSLLRLKRLMGSLKREDFDLVINLSFSPFSSYICHELELGGASVFGYSRTSDGFLKIGDDASAYYFAQCGAKMANRAHLREVWCNIAGFESDVLDTQIKKEENHDREGIVLALDTQGKDLSFESHKWTNIARLLLKVYDGNIYLLGSQQTEESRNAISLVLNSERIWNISSYSLADKIQRLHRAELLITTPGYMIPLADRVGVRTLAIFSERDSFWEKGPRTPGSRVLASDFFEKVASDQIVESALKVLSGEKSNFGEGEYTFAEQVPSYKNESEKSEFSWKLVEAIYLDRDWPALENDKQLESIAKFYELNQMAFEQLDKFVNCSDREMQLATQVLDRVDELIESIGGLESSLAPLVNWFRTEKIRIGPGEVEQLVRDTRKVHDMMNSVAIGYLVRYGVLSEADMEVRSENRSME